MSTRPSGRFCPLPESTRSSVINLLLVAPVLLRRGQAGFSVLPLGADALNESATC